VNIFGQYTLWMCEFPKRPWCTGHIQISIMSLLLHNSPRGVLAFGDSEPHVSCERSRGAKLPSNLGETQSVQRRDYSYKQTRNPFPAQQSLPIVLTP
jgi:hypothetical protein